MSSSDEISTLVEQVNAAAQAYSSPSSDASLTFQTTATSRHSLLAAAKALVTSLEDPEEEAWRFLLQPCAHACLTSAWQCGILDQWSKDVMTAKELAVKANADERLVVRMMRALTIYGIFTEVEEEMYKHSPLSLKLATPPLSLNALPLAARNLSGMSKLPEYLAKTSYRNPGDDPSAKSLFQYSNNTDLEFFQWLQTQPVALKTFNTSMAKSVATERARAGKGLADIYPFNSLGEGLSSPDEIVLVDVGGGQGQVLQDIRTHVPELAGKKMVLEDLPKTVEDHVSLENVDFVPYDFLTAEQPINGARAYLLRHILHDWPDRICRQILLNTIPALVAEKSRILIVEIILPPMNPPIFGALMDIQMMNYGGGGRKERQWRAIFESVGLEIVKIWPGVKSDSVMELGLKSS